MVAIMADINNGDDHGSLSMLATGRRMERHDKFMGEPTTGGEFGPEMLLLLQKKAPPPSLNEGFRKLKEGLRNTSGRLRVRLRNVK